MQLLLYHFLLTPVEARLQDSQLLLLCYLDLQEVLLVFSTQIEAQMIQVQFVFQLRFYLPFNQIVAGLDMSVGHGFVENGLRTRFLIDIHSLLERSQAHLAVFYLFSFIDSFVDRLDHFLLIMAETQLDYLLNDWLLALLLCKIIGGLFSVKVV